MARKRLVVFGLIGSVVDVGKGVDRWERWRPTVSMFQHADLLIDRFELICEPKFCALADVVCVDIASLSPETVIRRHPLQFDDPWDFQSVYATLHELARTYPFKPDEEDYLIHITTGTHVAQICLFLLTEARYLPGRLLQTQPKRGAPDAKGTWASIDLDLSRYDSIATRFADASAESAEFLKSGIATRNAAFNAMIAEIEQVAGRSKAPMLLMGPTGAGKSQLARKIYELKRLRHQLAGPFVEVNCATLKGDSAMSALFGHRKGAFTGAVADRPGLIKGADKGMLFLDEIGELGLDEQAMILRAIEEGRFLPVGADKETQSQFGLIAGTNRNLAAEVAAGRFREDLFARLNLWTFTLPGLAERREDIEPNLDYELERFAEREGTRVTFNAEARAAFLSFATSGAAAWRSNFRDLAGSVTRMATLCHGGRIDAATVRQEVARLTHLWSGEGEKGDTLPPCLTLVQWDAIDPFDRVQLAFVIAECGKARSLAEAGRALFAQSRQHRASTNDGDRLRKYLAKFGLTWADVHGAG